MAKFKSTKDMMAARNPLARKPVEPVDIYTPPVQVEAEKRKATPEPITPKAKKKQGTSKKPAPQTATPEKGVAMRVYSTYLSLSQIKGIKLRAIEQDVKDFAIVHEAINEYFKKHPL